VHEQHGSGLRHIVVFITSRRGGWRDVRSADQTSLRRALTAAAALVPAVLAVALAFRAGGYPVATTSLAATEMLLAIVLWTMLARHPLAGWSAPLAAGLTLLAALAGWTAWSAQWSVAPEMAAPEAARVVLYGAALVFGGLVCADPRRLRVAVGAVTVAMTALCLAALASRTLPDVLTVAAGEQPDRLSYPLSYWNALGLVAAIALILLVHHTLSADRGSRRVAAAAAAIPLVVATLVATTSAGAAGAAFAGTVVYAAAARPRGLLAVLALLAIPAAVATWALERAPIAALDGPSRGLLSAAHLTALVLVACAAAAVLLARAAPRSERPAARLRLRPVAAGLALAVVIAIAAALVFAHAGVGIRTEYWRVGVGMIGSDPVRGEGAGSFATGWVRDRERSADTRDAHSLFVETGAELGLVGLALLLAAFAVLGRGLLEQARRRRGDHALRCAVLAIAAAWTLHASVDWIWEQPAVGVVVFALCGAALARSAPAGGASGRSGAPQRVAVVVACALLAIPAGRLAVAASDLETSVRSARRGECGQARARALQSLRLRPTSSAYVVLARCALPIAPHAALPAIDAAVMRAPHDWRLHYDRAIVLAALGRDPRPATAAARALNPLEPGVMVAVARLDTGDPDVWRGQAMKMPFLLPW
jgi:hypothetical protein